MQLPKNTENEGSEDTSIHSRYLVFKLCGESYGAPLLQVREVIKFPKLKAVPRSAPYLRGVINLRGQILSVVDLRVKFEMRGYSENQGFVLVVETALGLVGAVVDSIEYVREITHEKIQNLVSFETKIPKEQFLGVARLEAELIHLLNLKDIVNLGQPADQGAGIATGCVPLESKEAA